MTTETAGATTVDADGLVAIEQREGKRLEAYRDSRGILTIGVGHTGRMSGPKVYDGMVITEDQCLRFLADDLAPVEAVINATVTVPLSQNEFNALASLGFNIGAGGLRTSTVVRKLNVGDVAGAADAFMNWSKPASLISRRETEKAQFLTSDGGSRAVASARAQTLGTLAATSQTTAEQKQTGGVALALGGTAAAAVTSTAGHGHIAWWIFGIVIVGGAIDGGLSIWHRIQATTLAANAAKQAVAAATTAKTPAPLEAATPVPQAA